MLLIIIGIISFFWNASSATKSENNLEVMFSDEAEAVLYDFTKNDTIEGWMEQSDIVREVGMSKADLSIQKSQIFRRAILFTLLNPQPNGACFAGVRVFRSLNLGNYNFISLEVRGQGENYNYKIILRHKNKNDEPNPTYEYFFKVKPNEFEILNLPLSEFKPYYRGKEVKNAEPLDKSRITSFGIQMYGGVYLPTKQSGVSSLEINWIKAT